MSSHYLEKKKKRINKQSSNLKISILDQLMRTHEVLPELKHGKPAAFLLCSGCFCVFTTTLLVTSKPPFPSLLFLQLLMSSRQRKCPPLLLIGRTTGERECTFYPWKIQTRQQRWHPFLWNMTENTWEITVEPLANVLNVTLWWRDCFTTTSIFLAQNSRSYSSTVMAFTVICYLWNDRLALMKKSKFLKSSSLELPTVLSRIPYTAQINLSTMPCLCFTQRKTDLCHSILFTQQLKWLGNDYLSA